MTEQSAATRATLALAAGTLIGFGILQSPRVAAVSILIACGILVYAIVLRRHRSGAFDSLTLFRITSIVALVIGALVFVWVTTLVMLPVPEVNWLIVTLGIAFVLSSAVGVFLFPARSRWFYGAFLLSFFVAQVYVIASRTPIIDVQYFQVEGAKALLSGVNPFAMRFPDLFSSLGTEPSYGPGVSVNGVLQFGYPYPPLSLVLIVPFQALFGDFRIGVALAYVITGWMIGRLGDPEAGRRVAVLSLLVAPVTMINTLGFSEPLVAMIGVGVLLIHRRRPHLGPYALGAFLAIKQYTFLVAPLYLLLMPRPWGRGSVARVLVRAMAVFALLTIPFLLWNPEAFVRSVYLLQLKQPLRSDAITFTAQFIAPYVDLSSLALSALPLIAAGIALVVSLRYAPVGMQGYALGSAFTFAMFFAFAKQASVPNYYVVVIAFCFAAAAILTPSIDDSMPVNGSAATRVSPSRHMTRDGG